MVFAVIGLNGNNFLNDGWHLATQNISKCLCFIFNIKMIMCNLAANQTLFVNGRLFISCSVKTRSVAFRLYIAYGGSLTTEPLKGCGFFFASLVCLCARVSD